MQKKEQQVTTEFQKWLKYNHWGTSFPFEIKYSYTARLNYKSNIKPHQVRALKIAKDSALIYKISDLDQMQKPMDGFIFVESEAYFVIFWEHTGYIIDVDDLAGEMMAGEKSLTKERANELAFKVCYLK